ncbi:PadR family transcriptional regulator [bacterium]|nr:PadR family transcriptional regulator [bacterium]|tara:strand:+ start:7477 stop:7836 length:360 start_codon:yes stop_codon:yes gene_type:complete
MNKKEEFDLENAKAQIRKGILEFPVLLIIAEGRSYASDIIKKLKKADLIIVEGTLYPLLSRLRHLGLVEYTWEESKSGPPRKYYTLTRKGREILKQLESVWKGLNNSINALIKNNEKNS